MRSSNGLVMLGIVAAWLALAPNAHGQSRTAPSPSGPSDAAPGPSGPAANIPDNKIDAAAAAVKQVSAVKDTYEQQLAQAPDNEKQRIADEGNRALAKAITDQGLSIEEYTTILRVAQNDASVREKIVQRLK
jgi:Domain of unknown function (DUF4168)